MFEPISVKIVQISGVTDFWKIDCFNIAGWDKIKKYIKID